MRARRRATGAKDTPEGVPGLPRASAWRFRGGGRGPDAARSADRAAARSL